MKMTRFLPFLLSLLLIFSVSNNSFASNDTETNAESSKTSKVLDEFSTVPNVADPYGEFIGKMTFEEYLTYLYGESFISLASVNGVVEEKMLYFTHYLQANSTWGSVKLLNGTNTIASHGCALTSATMAMSYLSYTDNPLIFNNKLLPHQPDGDELMYWGNVPKAYSGVILSSSYTESVPSKYYTSVDGIYSTVRGQIRQNRPVILGMVKPNGGTHFVIARGILETEYVPEIGSIAKKYIYIHDPGDKLYTSLEQYFNAGYKVRTLISYSK